MSKALKITQTQFIKMNRKASRDAALQNSSGWTATNKVHRSKKTYTRKQKHKA